MENPSALSDPASDSTRPPPQIPTSESGDDRAEIQRLEAIMQAARARQPAPAPSPRRLEAIQESVAAKLLTMPAPNQAKIDAEKNRAAEEDRRRQTNETARCLRDFQQAIGERYEASGLDNFATTDKAQGEVKQAMIRHGENLSERIQQGIGILLFGPSGTGKDHLLIGLGRQTIKAGYSVRWQSGQELLGKFRGIIASDESEEHFFKRLAAARVLIVSDPLPPFGNLTDFQSGMFFRLIDERYRHCRPTWVSLNVSDRAEAERRMGVSIVDRLTDGAVVRFCNWPSHRKPFDAR
jgi:DNA replication protein DnaC